MRGDPHDVLRRAGRVDDQEVALRAEAVDDQVVEHAARVVAEERVLRVADPEPRDVVHHELLADGRRRRTAHLDLAHVADVEKPGPLAHRVMLIEHARILHRHVPSAEIDHLGPHAAMRCVERSGPQCGR